MEQKIKIKQLGDGIYAFPPETNSFFAEISLRGAFLLDEEDDDGNWKIDLEIMEDYIKDKCPQFLGKDLWIGSAYEVWGFIILDKAPLDLNIKKEGSGFNYGSCNLLEMPFPCKILILAQND